MSKILPANNDEIKIMKRIDKAVSIKMMENKKVSKMKII